MDIGAAAGENQMRTILTTAIAMTIGLLVTTSGEAEAKSIIRSKSNICNNRGGEGCSSGTERRTGGYNTPSARYKRELAGHVSLLKRTKGTDSQPPKQKQWMTHNFRSGGATDGGVRSPRDLAAGQSSGKTVRQPVFSQAEAERSHKGRSTGTQGDFNLP